MAARFSGDAAPDLVSGRGQFAVPAVAEFVVAIVAAAALDDFNRFRFRQSISLALELAPEPPRKNRQPRRPSRTASAANQNSSASGRKVAAHFSANWMAFGLAFWLVGAAMVLISMAVGQLRLRQFSRNAQSLRDANWTQLLEEACETLRLRRAVTLLQSADNLMPLTWGWWRPVVLLPAEAAHWPAERRRVVLLHELAHVKRWDCLTQLVARIVCALYWFNPLVWLAARQMCVERERACDDLVLDGGCKASDYATHLVDIARTFRRMPLVAAIAMARSSQLEGRIAAIVDASRNRRLRSASAIAILALMAASPFLLVEAEQTPSATRINSAQLRQQQIKRLEAFSAGKEKQSQALAAAAGEKISPEFQQFFDAATKGDWQTVTNRYEGFKQNHPQYGKQGNRHVDMNFRTTYWQPVLEICLAYDHVVRCEPKYTQMAVDGIINSIPAGSIYFGGTDPGRGVPTAFCKSHMDADPFFTLTQNALADGSYLEYLRETYGERSELLDAFIKVRSSDTELHALDSEMREAKQTLFSLNNGNPDAPGYKAAQDAVNKLGQRIEDRTKGVWVGLEAQSNAPGTDLGTKNIYVPTSEDLQKCFTDYTVDIQHRWKENKLKPGEHISESSGAIQISGQTAVMEINGLMAKIIFDKNPAHEFYTEESFPLDWMYPYLEPHGLIFKINRQPLVELSDEVVQRDHEYWRGLVTGMIGDWLNDETPVKEVTDFAEKIYLRRNLSGFKGDPRFVQNDYACKMFSKERANIADLYVWRMDHAKTSAEKERMAREADFAYGQAFALCPYSTEAAKGYEDFLKSQNRLVDAALVTQTAAQFASAAKLENAKSLKSAMEAPKSPIFEMRLVQDTPSADTQRMTLVLQNKTTGQTQFEPLYVQKSVLLDQTAIQSAEAIKDALGNSQIDIVFTDSARKRFAKITSQNIGRRLAIIIEGQVRCAPIIQRAIPDGTAKITGVFSDQEAETLARKINDTVAK